MKTLIFGAGGQLGQELQHSAPSCSNVVALSSRDCDVTDAAAVEAAVADIRPAVIINSAAYTNVDKAESEELAARRVNADAVGYIADSARRNSARFIHISTDFVFDGLANSPISPRATPRPISVYGQTKLSGEQAARRAGEGRFLVLRTSWVYSQFGRNFVRTMLRLMQERESLSIVADQVGSPTCARGLANVSWNFAKRDDLSGIFHWSDSGSVSWHGFALEIQKLALEFGLLEQRIPVLPIASSEYPTAATRPAYSVLDCSDTEIALGVKLVAWQENLKAMIQELVN